MTGSGSLEPYPTVAEVEHIATLDDACVRNLRITDAYARLSAAMRDLIGEGANWCSIATWASRQAGCTVRGEDFGDRLADLLRGEWEVRRPLLSKTLRLPLDARVALGTLPSSLRFLCGLCVSAGNLKASI